MGNASTLKDFFDPKNLSKVICGALLRFSIAYGLAIVTTIVSIFLVHFYDRYKGEPISWFLFFCATSSIISFAAQIMGEDIFSGRTKNVIISALVTLWGGLVLYYSTIGISNLSPQLIILLPAIFLLLMVLMFTIPFWRRPNDVPMWNFLWAVTFSFFIATIFSGIVQSSISILFFSFDGLFGLEVPSTVFTDLAIVCYGLLMPLIFGSLVPFGNLKYNESFEVSKFLKTLAIYVLTPIMLVYLVVLYIYICKIIISWNLPRSYWVSCLTSISMLLLLGISFIALPIVANKKNQSIHKIIRILPVLVIPPLVLMTIGIIRRLSDYGVSVPRIFLLAANVWFYVVLVYLIITKSTRMRLIPISFCLLFLLLSLPPCGVFQWVRMAYVNKIERQLTTLNLQNKLPLNESNIELWLDNDTSIAINNCDMISFLRENYPDDAKRLFDLENNDTLWDLRRKYIDIVEVDTNYGVSYFFQNYSVVNSDCYFIPMPSTPFSQCAYLDVYNVYSKNKEYQYDKKNGLTITIRNSDMDDITVNLGVALLDSISKADTSKIFRVEQGNIELDIHSLNLILSPTDSISNFSLKGFLFVK